MRSKLPSLFFYTFVFTGCSTQLNKDEKKGIMMLAAPASHYTEAIGTAFEVMCFQFLPGTDEVVGPLIPWIERDPKLHYLVAQVTHGEKI